MLLAHFHPHITSLCCVEPEKLYVMLDIPFLFDSRGDMHVCVCFMQKG